MIYVPQICRWLGLAIALVVALGLSGCVEAESGIQYRDQVHGTLVQQVHLKPDLTQLQRLTADGWLKAVGDRLSTLPDAQQVKAADGWTITMPFYNGADLQTRFNHIGAQIFSPAALATLSGSDSLIQPGRSQLILEERNWLVVQRNHLIYDLDLRSLWAAQGSVWLPLQSVMDWQFTLNTPWAIQLNPGSLPPSRQTPTQFTWMLRLDTANHIDVTFWVLSPLGMGAVAIGILTLLGFAIAARQPRQPR
jgi:hypothetical protein